MQFFYYTHSSLISHSWGPECHFYLNVNLKAVSLILVWMLICFESLFALGCDWYVKLWAVVLLNQNTFLFFNVFQRAPKCFSALPLTKGFLSSLIFSQWQKLALRPVVENETLMLFRLLKLSYFNTGGLFWSITVLLISYSSRSKNTLC